MRPALDRGPLVWFEAVSLRRGGVPLLEGVDWRVERGENWAILGPNGAGKTTLLQVLTGYMWPSEGRVTVLGGEFGRIDLPRLRRDMGWVSSAVAERLPLWSPALDVVLTGRFATLKLFDAPSEEDRDRALTLLDALGCGRLADRRYGVLSQGEKQRVLIARALMADPRLLVLDEPAEGLDLAAREDLLESLEVLCRAGDGPTLLLVTHHLEELVAGITHVLLLRGGRVVAAGEKREVVTDRLLSHTMGIELEVIRRNDRFWAVPDGLGHEDEFAPEEEN